MIILQSIRALPTILRRPKGRSSGSLLFVSALFGLALAASTVVVSGAASAAVPSGVNQCNGTDNVGGEATICGVTIVNRDDLQTGIVSSSVTVSECHGAANAPPTCILTTTSSSQLITSVTQCNGSGNGGGGQVACHVSIINDITGVATTSPATVNQCNVAGQGGGTAPTYVCDPIGVTTNATVTQCNSSGNGGGGTMRVLCTVTPSTETAALPMIVNQCVGSGNGGGATVTCSVSITNTIVPPVVAPTPVVPPVVTPPVTPPVVTPPVVTPPVVTPPVVGTPPSSDAPESRRAGCPGRSDGHSADPSGDPGGANTGNPCARRRGVDGCTIGAGLGHTSWDTPGPVVRLSRVFRVFRVHLRPGPWPSPVRILPWNSC